MGEGGEEVQWEEGLLISGCLREVCGGVGKADPEG
jgi:hypothetical protein